MNAEQNQHSILTALKALAIELGRCPTRDEFITRSSISKHFLTRHFDSYRAACLAADLMPDKESARKFGNEVFERKLSSHLNEHVQLGRHERKPYPHLAVISDIHWPFHSQRVIDRFFAWLQKDRPKHVVLAGDAMDMYSHAKFPRSHNVFTPKEEEALARKGNEDFWAEVQRILPEAECVQLLGNHDVRASKRVLEVAPTLEHWVARYMEELFSFPGVKTVFNPREEVFFDDVMIHHGYLSQLGQHRDHTLFNAIVGHTHRAGVVFREIRGQTLWEMNCGYAGDPTAKGLTYTPQKITGWTPGFGVCDPDGPRVIIC